MVTVSRALAVTSVSVLLAGLAVWFGRHANPSYLLFQNALVVDGTGLPGFTADVLVKNDRIVRVEKNHIEPLEGCIVVNATGLILSPGLVDTHAHDDRAVLVGPEMENKVSQGITATVVGNCGVSLSPFSPTASATPIPPMNLLAKDPNDWIFAAFGDYVNAIEKSPPALNVAALVGHTTLRVQVMDSVERAANAPEIAHMQHLLHEAMQAGASGLSTGLEYDPALASSSEEVLALATVAGQYGGIYTTHIRNENAGVVAAVQEALETSEKAGVPVVISHHKAVGKQNRGRVKQSLQLIEEARNRGQPVHVDVYPYVAGSTVLNVPRCLLSERVRCLVLITWSVPHPDCAGKDMAVIMKEWQCSLEVAVERLSPAGAIYFQMTEEDVRTVLRHPAAMIGSDGLPHDIRPHPRLWGSHTRVLGHYVREGVYTVEEAVHRMTGLPASVFGWRDRGVIRPQAFADLLLFNPTTIRDTATFTDPMQRSEGIEMVVVNGAIVWSEGKATGHRPGRFLRRQAGA